MSDLAAIKIPVDTSDIPKAIQIVNKLQTELVSFEKAVRAGTLTVFSQNAAIAKSAKQLQSLGYSYGEARGMVYNFSKSLKTLNDVELAQAGRGLNQSQRDVRNFELGVQQAGYQIGDFAVQVQSGTSPLVAFSQQFSQLAGFFGGPWGAAVGAGTAVISGLALAFFNASGDAKSLSESMSDLKSAVDAVAEATDVYSSEGIEKLISKYGELDQQTLSLVANQTLYANLLASKELKDGLAALQDAIGGSWFAIGISEQASSLINLQSMFNLTANDAKSLKAAFDEVAQAKTYEDQAAALTTVSDYLGIVLSAQESVTDEQLALYEAVNQSLEAVKTLSETQPKQGWLAAAIGEAETLATALWDAAAAKIAATESELAPGTSPRPMPRGQGTIIDLTKPAKVSKGSGTGKKDVLGDFQKQLELEQELLGTTQAYQKVRRALGEDFAKTNPEVIAGLIEQANQIEHLKELEKQRKQVMDTVTSSLETGLMSMVDGTKSVKDAFKSMAADILKELYRVLVVQRLVGSIAGAFNFASGPSTGSLGLPFGGANASGGSMVPGKSYLVGENGPELVIPRHSGTVVNANQTANAGNSGGVTVQNNITVTGSDAAMVRAEVAKMIPQITNATKTAVIDARLRGGQMKAAFS